MPSRFGNAARDTSGRGGSILITSAPRAASVRAHSGPASTREKSTTLISSSGPAMSIPFESGGAGAGGIEGLKSTLEILRRPDRLLHFEHRFVGGSDTLVDRDPYELLGRGMRDGRAGRQFLSNRQRDFIEFVVGHDEIDQAPAFERCRVVTAAEHCELFCTRWAGPHHLTLDAAEQRMQAERDLD